jgi:hypothetical protein
MDRVPDFESVGCGFEPRRGRLNMGFLGDLPSIFWGISPASRSIGATQLAQDEPLAHLKHVLHVHPFFTLCLEPLYQKCPIIQLDPAPANASHLARRQIPFNG